MNGCPDDHMAAGVIAKKLMRRNPMKDNESGDKAAPELLWVQLTPSGGTISYVMDPRKVHDNGKPVYQYVRADLVADWQPIETVPRDGKPVLLAFPDGHVQQHVMKPKDVPVVWFSQAPTYWRPLPPPPIQTGGVVNSEVEGD